MTIAVIGATGLIGRALVPALLARGRKVRALVRRASAVPGAETVVGDLLEPATLGPLLEGVELAINVATAVPKPGQPPDYRMNDRLRLDGAANLLAALPPGARLLQQSIAFICGDGANWVDEATPPLPGPSATAMEAKIAASAQDTLVLRGGLFYGPGTGTDDHWRALARRGALELPGDGSAYISLVHVADYVAALLAAVERWPRERLLNIVDDRPLPWSDVFGRIALAENAAPPKPGGPSRMVSNRVSNARAKAALAWRPGHPEFRP
jgi:nucleoside-diphosphate-sugar epimerase